MFRTKKEINKISVKKNWLERLNNFLKDARLDEKNEYFWLFKKEMKWDPKGPMFGYDKSFYPSSTILMDDSRIDLNTSRRNKVKKIYVEDINKGMEFFNSEYRFNYFNEITNNKDVLTRLGTLIDSVAPVEIDEKTGEPYRDDLFKVEKEYLISRIVIKNMISQLNFDKDSIFDLNFKNVLDILDIFVKLQTVFQAEDRVRDINCTLWKLDDDFSIVNDFDTLIIGKLRSWTDKISKKVHHSFKKIKGLRSLLGTYNEFKKTATNTLLKVVYSPYGDHKFLLLVAHQNEKLYVYEYDFLDIQMALKDYIDYILSLENIKS